LQKKFELKIQELYPDKYLPLYSMVTFSHIRYSEAHKLGLDQEKNIKDIMSKHNIKAMFENNSINSFIDNLVKNNSL